MAIASLYFRIHSDQEPYYSGLIDMACPGGWEGHWGMDGNSLVFLVKLYDHRDVDPFREFCRLTHIPCPC